MKKEDLLFELESLSAQEAAARLLGCNIVRLIDGEELIGKIVETEAYDQSDPASHSFRGQTKRNAVMFGPAGYAYVYFTYGMHYCLNVVIGGPGNGSAVLIRAMEPLKGLETMMSNRGVNDPHKLLSGPAKLTQSMRVDLSLNGHDLGGPPLKLVIEVPLPGSEIVWNRRIGISREGSKHRLWRASLKDNPFLSKR